MFRLGVVSDSHGLLRSRVLEALEGCDRILHAGDVGEGGILETLGQIAPVEAVRGNTDYGDLGALPESLEGQAEGVRYRMIHRRQDIEADWSRDAGLIVFGHSHRPELEWRGGCVLLNPGAIGHRRFSLPLTLAMITIDGERLIPEILSIEG